MQVRQKQQNDDKCRCIKRLGDHVLYWQGSKDICKKMQSLNPCGVLLAPYITSQMHGIAWDSRVLNLRVRKRPVHEADIRYNPAFKVKGRSQDCNDQNRAAAELCSIHTGLRDAPKYQQA